MEESIVRENLLTRPGYSPYCGSDKCTRSNPRTQFNGYHFVCACGWRSQFPKEFTERYVAFRASNWKPSDFAAMGNPSCSRWGKSEFEWIALAYVRALANDGDTWKTLTREQTYNLLTDEQKRDVHNQLDEHYQHRFDAIAGQITGAIGALKVGGFWDAILRTNHQD